MNEKESSSKSFVDKARSKIENMGNFMGDIADNPEKLLKRFWKKYEKWVFLLILYISSFFIFRWMGKSNNLAWIIAVFLLVGFPFFLLWIITKFIPEIKVKDKVIFSRNNLNLEKQLKYGFRGLATVAKEIYKAYPTFSLVVVFALLLLLFIAV